MTRILTYAVTSNGLVRRGGSERDVLIPGEYKPSALTTGANSMTLPAYNSPSATQVIISTPGTVLQNLTIYGDLIIRTTDVTIKNCVLRGGSHHQGNASGIIDANNSAVRRLLVEDCTIFPQKMSFNRDGIVGHDYIIRRCNIYNTTDGCGAFITTANGTNCNVTIEANYIHDLAYFYPDAVHSDGTHNDLIQIQGGANIHVIGNYLHGSSVMGPGSGQNPLEPRLLSETPTHIAGAGIIIQKQSITAALSNVVVEMNWFHQAKAALNMKPGTYTVRNNRMSRTFFRYNSSSMYVLRGDNSTTTTVNGINTNVWDDTGAPILSVATGGSRSAGFTSNQYPGIRWNDIPD